MSGPNKIQRVNYKIPEKKLLAGLLSDGKVAILANKDDLKILADAVMYYGLLCGQDIKEDCAEMSIELRQLLAEAFP